MRHKVTLKATGFAFVLILFVGLQARAGEKLRVSEGWRLQTSERVSADGTELSSIGYDASDWFTTEVPMTVLAALVENGVYPDPYYGLNMKEIPGFMEGRWLVMPKDSPFYPSWWYRTEVNVPERWDGKHITLHFDGINYKANIWVNGMKVGGTAEVVGMFREFSFEVTGLVTPGEKATIAVEVVAPGKLPDRKYATKQLEATTGWDDHNPQPPDMNMGIWEDVWFFATGPVDVRHPYVSSDLDVPGLEQARLTVSVFLENVEDEEVTGRLKGRIENIKFSKKVTLKGREMAEIEFMPSEYKQLVIDDPRVWWPNPLGSQELYDLELEFVTDGKVSDSVSTTFGIRKAETYINDEGWRGYRINGRNVLIRGGAWMTTDMLLRLEEERYEALVLYAREANLNMLRSEGFSIRETEEFYNLCDRYGVMVTQQIFGRSIPDEALAIDSVRDMMLRIRNHPSLVHFLGHDETFPTETLDQAYQDMIRELTPERSYQPHSGAFQVRNRFETGGTRTGTLELWTYAGPAQYYLHKKDGAWGFAQSGGIGGVIAQEESIRRMMPEEALWPLWSEAFSFHTVIQGGDYYNKLVKALEKRYGEPAGFEDFVKTATVMNYESARGMYEAYGRNKYDALGITTWKYDVAWPAALTWQYIDYYLLPTGAYYGAKKACEELHVQYSYDDDSIWVVNSLYENFEGIEVQADVYNIDMGKLSSQEATVEVGPDGKTEAFKMEWPDNLTRTYFLHLELHDSKGELITDNLYWLSTKPDRPGKKFYGVLPLQPTSYPDLSMLRGLDKVKLDSGCWLGQEGEDMIAEVTLRNPSDDVAFYVMLGALKGEAGLQVAPSYWSENHFSILPEKEITVTVRFAKSYLEGKDLVIAIDGWNIEPTACVP